MTLKPQHLGLTFNESLVQSTHNHRESEPVSDAIHYLMQPPSDMTPLASAQLAGLRYQFLDDEDGAIQVINTLQNVDFTASTPTYVETLQAQLAWLSVVESVRNHPAWQDIQYDWLNASRQQIQALNAPPDDATLLEGFWLGALNIGASIVFEDERLFERGADMYQLAVNEHIHPEGYLKGLVDDEDVSDTYLRQVLGAGALVLMAEMAEVAGVDLWSIENRGITPITATTYLMYYYYYPDKWKWDNTLTADTTESIIKIHGAFVEIANRRSPIRGIDILLEDHRPLFSQYTGGLTTLTHGTPAPPKKNRWRLFG